MERSVFGGKRTRAFFCEANRSDQKAECETNHKLTRWVIPKRTSLQHLVREDTVLLSNATSLLRTLPNIDIPGSVKTYGLYLRPPCSVSEAF